MPLLQGKAMAAEPGTGPAAAEPGTDPTAAEGADPTTAGAETGQTTGGTDTDALPEALAIAPRRARFSPIWIVPIVAALVAIGLAVDRYLSEGPTITITFTSAHGVEAGKTFVKYKDVNIGQVTGVRLADDLVNVEITARIAKSAAHLMVEDARFWVVRPRVSLAGISGLQTILSGNYIGFEAGSSDTSARRFTGLEVPPTVTGDVPGRQFVISTEDLGSLGIGSPVYFRRLPVGQVIAYDLAPDGKSVSVRIFVREPYDRFVTTHARFWNASGIDVSLTASGLDVRTQSLAALLEGGIAFEPPRDSPGTPAVADAGFTLYADRATAMRLPESISTRYVLHFRESIRGLATGAPVSFYGVQVGEVTDVGLTFDPKTLDVRPRVEIRVFPQRLLSRLPAAQEAKAEQLVADIAIRHKLVQQMVERRGLRAQLATGSLVTGQQFVSLGYFPQAAKAKIDWTMPVPELPTQPSEWPALEAKLVRLADKLERMPIDAIGNDLRDALAGMKEALRSAKDVFDSVNADVVPALEKTLLDARGALGSAEKMLASTQANLVGAGAPAQIELRSAMQELARAARALRVLADYLERHPEALIRGKPASSAPRPAEAPAK